MSREASLVRALVALGTGVLLLSLVIVGIATAALLHAQRVRALDQALLAAAHAHAQPEEEEGEPWEFEHSQAPVEVWLPRPGDPRIPPGGLARVMRRDEPLIEEVGDTRVLLLVAEVEEHDEREDEVPDAHVVIAAAAPRPTLARTIGPFVAAYALVSVLVAAAAAAGWRALSRRALAPLERAQAQAERVVGLGQGERLAEEGPAEVAALLRAVNALLERLERAWQAQVAFTAEAAHELRTPVTILRGELEVARRRPRSAEEYGTILDSLQEEVGRLGALVEGLLALARVDAGQVEQGRELVRAGEIAMAAAGREGRAVEASGGTLTVEIRQDPEIVVHRALLEAAVGNLVRNAAVHASGAPVRLSVQTEGEKVVFTVEDSGPGVPLDQREVLFQRFARASGARRTDRSGLGLGLPLAREVARRHGGDCRLEGAPGGGCRAVLTVFRSADLGLGVQIRGTPL